MDLAAASSSLGEVRMLTNNGVGGLLTSSTNAVGTFPRLMVAADLNGDGWNDLVTANNAIDTLSVLTNDKSGRFVLSSSLTVGVLPNFVTAADINGDTRPNVITVSSGSSTLTVMTNNGSGQLCSLRHRASAITRVPSPSRTLTIDRHPDLI